MEEIIKGLAKGSMEVDFEEFKLKFFEFVKVNLGINLLVPHFCFKTKEFFSQSKGGSIIISCSDKYKLFEMVNFLEKTSFYEKRLEMEDCNLKVKQLEGFEIPEKVNLLKRFFCKLESLLPNSFKIETPATVTAGEIDDDGFVRIHLSFIGTYMVDQFISAIPAGWNYEILGLKKIVLNIELIEIKEFVSGKHSIFNERNDDSRLGSVLDRNTFNDEFNPKDEKGLRFVGTDLSFLNTLNDHEEVIKKPVVIVRVEQKVITLPKIDVDIGKQKNQNQIIETKKDKKEIKTKTKIIEVMVASTQKSLELINLVNQRKSFANGVIAGLQTKYKQLDSRIKIETGRFTHTAEGFLVSVPTVFNQQVVAYLKENNILYRDNKDGNFWVIYPDKYASSKNLKSKDDGKALIKLAEKERDAVIRVLANNNFYHKKGGPAKKKPGVFSISKTSNIADHSMMILFVPNKKQDTLNQIFKLVENHYSSVENKDLVSVNKDDVDFKIIVSFATGYFKVLDILDNASQILDNNRGGIQPQASDQTVAGKDEHIDAPVEKSVKDEHHEVGTFIEIALESDQEIDKKIKELQDQKNKNRHNFLISVSDDLSKSFSRVIAEKGMMIFRSTQNEGGLQTLSQLSEDDTKEIIGLIIENLKV